MTAKEYLQQTIFLNKKINQMIREKEALQSVLYSVGSVPSGERVQSGSVGNRTENLIVKIDEKERKINDEIDKLVDLKSEITEEIYKIDKETYSEVLIRRYIDFQNWGKIADEMGYSLGYVFQLHGIALKKISKFLVVS